MELFCSGTTATEVASKIHLKFLTGCFAFGIGDNDTELPYAFAFPLLFR